MDTKQPSAAMTYDFALALAELAANSASEGLLVPNIVIEWIEEYYPEILELEKFKYLIKN